MNSENDVFVELFSVAQSDALSPRESAIIELRYGLTSRKDFVALVLKYKLFWRLSPFMLSLPPDA